MGLKSRGPSRQWVPVQLCKTEREALDTFCLQELPMLLRMRSLLLEDLGDDPDGVHETVRQKAQGAIRNEQETFREQLDSERRQPGLESEAPDSIPSDIDTEDLANADFARYLPWYQLNYLEHQLLPLQQALQSWSKLHAGLYAELLYDDLVDLFRRYKNSDCSWESVDGYFEICEKLARISKVETFDPAPFFDNSVVLGMLHGPDTEDSNRQGPAAATDVMLGLVFKVPSGSLSRLRKRALRVFPFFDVDRSPNAN